MGVNIGEDHVLSRLGVLCFQVRMERILSANKLGSEVVSDPYADVNKWLWS